MFAISSVVIYMLLVLAVIGFITCIIQNDDVFYMYFIALFVISIGMLVGYHRSQNRLDDFKQSCRDQDGRVVDAVIDPSVSAKGPISIITYHNVVCIVGLENESN